MKNVMDFPFAGKHESDGQRRNDLLDLEGTVILVIQFLRWTARFNVASVEHN